MTLIDTHTHLYLKQFDDDRDNVIRRAVAEGVERFYLPNIDSGSVGRMLELETAYPGRCFAMMGLHPCSVRENVADELAVVGNWLRERNFCAVGEIGIDLYWDKTFLEQQKSAFLQQVEWAKDAGLPIVIHSRKSIDLIIDLLRQVRDVRLRGIFHCFDGNPEQARAIIELGFYLGIGGILTYKNAGLAQTLAAIDLQHIVLETDSPYLAPVPHRGKRNESAYVRLVAEKLASLKSVPVSEVARITTENAETVFTSGAISNGKKAASLNKKF